MESGTCCSRPVLTLHVGKGSGSMVVCLLSWLTFAQLTIRPFASCEPHSCCRIQASSQRSTWQHVHRGVLRELEIEFEATRHWTSSFFTAQLRVIHLCARFGISQDRMWNPHETAVRLVPKSRVSPCLRLARLRHGAACGHRLSMRRRPIECTLMDHSFRASSCPTLRRTGSRRRLSWT